MHITASPPNGYWGGISPQEFGFAHRRTALISPGLGRDADPREEPIQDKGLLEGQFWWAFSCLAVAGRRNEEDFHVEVVRRNSGFYPDAVEVDSILHEACGRLPLVLNRAKTGRATARRVLSGWERHLLALSTGPGD